MTRTPTELEEGRARLALASMAIDHAEPADQRSVLAELLMALGLAPDPDALGCNIGEKFNVGSRKLTKAAREDREGDDVR